MVLMGQGFVVWTFGKPSALSGLQGLPGCDPVLWPVRMGTKVALTSLHSSLV